MTEQLQFDAVDWHLFLNTADARKAARVVRRLQVLVGLDLETISADRYWKNPTLTVVQLRSRIQPITEPAEAVYSFLLTVKRLVHRFSTAGPQVYEGGAVEISAHASGGFVESGVNSMEASMRNFGTAPIGEG